MRVVTVVCDRLLRGGMSCRFMVGYCDTLDRIFLSKGVLVLTDRSNMVVIPLVIPEKTLKTSDLDIVLLVISSNITSNITTYSPPLRGEVVILL